MGHFPRHCTKVNEKRKKWWNKSTVATVKQTHGYCNWKMRMIEMEKPVVLIRKTKGIPFSTLPDSGSPDTKFENVCFQNIVNRDFAAREVNEKLLI